jgi:hypothetical protein
LYLNDLDHYIGGKVQLYRRVGDDFIAFDPSKEKLEEILLFVKNYAAAHKLVFKIQKVEVIPCKNKFCFIGYKFENGKIMINDSSVRKHVSLWKKKFSYNQKSFFVKKRKLNWQCFKAKDNCRNEFIQLLMQYPFVNNDDEMKELSLTFYKIISKYFTGNYSKRDHRVISEKLRGMHIPSLFKYYIDIKNGRKKISNLSV